ncbi:MAG: hypothetical protein NZ580_01325, partial [Bacteroidia bacterium]|nr:hypothetical protein [Bacteroidia bacterium]
STPKPFTDPNITQQQILALESWLFMRPRPQIIYIGEEEGVEEVCRQYGVEFIPDVARRPSGLPLISDIFKRGEQAARYDIIAYVNADIVISPILPRAIQIVQKRWKRFLLVSSPYLADLSNLRIQEGFEQEALKRVKRLPTSRGADLFVFPKGLYRAIPPLAVGRFFWDNWLMCELGLRLIPVIDATGFVLTFHPIEETSTHYMDYLKEKNPAKVDEVYGKFMSLFQADVHRNFSYMDNGHLLGRSAVPYYIDKDGKILSRGWGALYRFWLQLQWQSWIYRTAPLRRKLGLYRWWRY